MLWDVCEEHLDEAAFRWTQWERALLAPDFTLVDAAEWEERARAHVDGLVAGGAPVEEGLLVPALEEEELGRVSVATLSLLEGRRRAEDVRWLLRGAVGRAQRTAIQRALEVCEWKGVGEALLPLLENDDVELQTAALEVLVFRDEAPEAILGNLLTHSDARLRIAALRGLRTPSRSAPRTVLHSLLASANPAIQHAAMEAGLVWGARDAWAACRRSIESGEAHCREALLLWAMGCTEEELTLLLERSHIPEQRADALWALGFSGRIAAVEVCIEYMKDEQWARLAGEAFSAITGLRLEGPYARTKEREEEAIAPEDEDLDADLIPRAEDFLPWPDIEAVATWWRQERGRFVRGTRYLMGHLFEGGVLLATLERGPMRRRHVLARELAIRTKGTSRVPTRAFARRQRAELERASAACSQLRIQPLERLLR
jgi:uncharacterized protein (TIGR02270 family)